MSPAYNINDLTESCNRMEIAISNLQKDVRELKDMKSKIDSIFTLLQKLNENRGATAVNNRGIHHLYKPPFPIIQNIN